MYRHVALFWNPSNSYYRVKHGSSLFLSTKGGGKEASYLKSVRPEHLFLKNTKVLYQNFTTTPKNANTGFSYSFSIGKILVRLLHT